LGWSWVHYSYSCAAGDVADDAFSIFFGLGRAEAEQVVVEGV